MVNDELIRINGFTMLEIGSVALHSGSMVYNEFNGKITETRGNLDEPECGSTDPISNPSNNHNSGANNKKRRQKIQINHRILLLDSKEERQNDEG